MNDEVDIEAAEYVLGTLPADERARFASRLAGDPELRQAVRRWQARLAPLDDTAAAETPSPEIWRGIERAGFGTLGSVTAEPQSNVVQLRRRVAFWRGASIAVAALAAGLAAIVVIDRMAVTPQASGRYFAVVDSGGREPALVAEVDTTTGLIRVRSLATETPAGRSLELWHVPEGQAPRSLGILKAAGDAQTFSDAAAKGPIGGIIAVSVEPEGGSPSGAPTGPIVYTGRLIPVE